MTREPIGRTLTIITCDDDIALTVLNRCAVAAGFEVVADSTSAPELVARVDSQHPDVVVVRHELVGTLGADVAKELLSRPDPPVVVIASPDPGAQHMALNIGAFSSVNPHDPELTVQVLSELAEQLTSGERRSTGERRSGTDRRVVQDWSKVFSQRRSGSDRRTIDRRSNESNPTPE